MTSTSSTGSTPPPSSTTSSSTPQDTSSSAPPTQDKNIKGGAQGQMIDAPTDSTDQGSVDSTKSKSNDQILKYQKSAMQTQTMIVKNTTQQAALDNVSEKQPNLDAFSGDAKPLPLSNESINLISEFQFGPQEKKVGGSMDFMPGEDIDPSMYGDDPISLTPDAAQTPSTSTSSTTASPNKYTSTIGSYMVSSMKGLLSMISENTDFKTTASKLQADNMQMSFSQATLAKETGISAAKMTMASKVVGGLMTTIAGVADVSGGLVSYARSNFGETTKLEKEGIANAQGELKDAETALQNNKTDIPLKEKEIEELKATSDRYPVTTGVDRASIDANIAANNALATEMRDKANLALPDKQAELDRAQGELDGMISTPEASRTKQQKIDIEEKSAQVDKLTGERDNLQATAAIDGPGARAKLNKDKADAEASLTKMKEDTPKLEKKLEDASKNYDGKVSARANRIGSWDQKMTMMTRGVGQLFQGIGGVISGALDGVAAEKSTMSDFARSMKGINDSMTQTLSKSIDTSSQTISGATQTMLAVNKSNAPQG